MMLGRSRLTFVFLAVAVTCAVAQHAPPVGELDPRAPGVAGAGVAGRAGREQHLVPQHLYSCLWFPALGAAEPHLGLIRHSWNQKTF